jgi:hypothetical protein
MDRPEVTNAALSAWRRPAAIATTGRQTPGKAAWHARDVPASSSPFAERTLHRLGTASTGGWQLKRYAIAVAPAGPRPEIIRASDTATSAALSDAGADLVSLPLDGHPARAGFTIIHEARPACFLQINRWRDGVDLVQTYLTAPHDAPDRWTAVTDGAIGCVWELPVISHERDAWVRHMLGPADGPHLRAYLDDLLDLSAGTTTPATSAATTARTFRVAGERFEVRLRDGDRRRFVYDYAWLTGPDDGYGFSASGGAELDDGEHVDQIRTFLDGIDPATGHLAGG